MTSTTTATTDVPRPPDDGKAAVTCTDTPSVREARHASTARQRCTSWAIPRGGRRIEGAMTLFIRSCFVGERKPQRCPWCGLCGRKRRESSQRICAFPTIRFWLEPTCCCFNDWAWLQSYSAVTSSLQPPAPTASRVTSVQAIANASVSHCGHSLSGAVRLPSFRRLVNLLRHSNSFKAKSVQLYVY